MSHPETESADLLYGVPAIASHLGIRPRQAHHQIDRRAIPTFRIGGVPCARRSTLAEHFARLEREATATPEPEPGERTGKAPA